MVLLISNPPQKNTFDHGQSIYIHFQNPGLDHDVEGITHRQKPMFESPNESWQPCG